MAETHRWRPLSIPFCREMCGNIATMSYSRILDGESQGTEYYCATCANVKIDAITSAPKPPSSHPGKNHSKLGTISSDQGSPYARRGDGHKAHQSKRYYRIPKAH